MAVGKEEIKNRFGYHRATAETAGQHEEIREGFIAFAEFLDKKLSDGRAKSSAMTKLQETSMWANFAIAEKAPLVLPNPVQEFDIRSTMAQAPKPGPTTIAGIGLLSE